ncbi:MAG: DUF447 family protein [Asgard group archaeon]|nr:DUF447 family protein [Asgard group archaeon]
MSTLTSLEQNTIYEVIVSTYSDEKKPNAATMGIILDSNDYIVIKPFNETDTNKNLEKYKACIVNFTLDPTLFVNCSLFQEELTSSMFVKSDQIEAPLLLSCQENYLALIVEKIENISSIRKAFYCKVVHSNLKSSAIQPYTRAFTSLIEILIHSTRLIIFSENIVKNKSKLLILKSFIIHHTELIRRITDENSIYQKLLNKIYTKISSLIDNT